MNLVEHDISIALLFAATFVMLGLILGWIICKEWYGL